MLKGTLDDFTLPDIFRLMSLAKRTGKVDVKRSAGEGKVFFRDGEVYYAESTVSREPLGQKLIRSGALTEGALMKALDEHAVGGGRVGEILVRNGSVSADQLQRAVQQQIEDSVFDLLRWGAGEFNWDAGVVADVEVPISVSVENLIIEASRRLDELEVIARKIPSEATILKMAPTPPEGAVEINITPEEWRMLVLVNGTRSVHDIAASTGTDDLTAMRSLYGLVSAGLVEVAESGEEQDDSAAEQDHVVGFGDLTSNQTAVAQTAMVPDVEPPIAAVADEAGPFLPTSEDVPQIEEVPAPHGDLVNAADQLTGGPETPEDVPAEFRPLAPEPDLRLVTDGDGPADPEPYIQIDPEPEFQIPAQSAPHEDEPVLSSADEVFFSSLEESETPLPETSFDIVDPGLPVDSFDAPQPDELITRIPESDDFLNDLLGAGPGDPLEPSFEEPSPAEAASMTPPPAPVAPAAPQPEVPSEPAAAAASPEEHVDRASMVRELAGLFSEDVPRTRQASQPKPSNAEGGDEPDGRKRVEDDDQVNRGLISRLIDGVKGL